MAFSLQVVVAPEAAAAGGATTCPPSGSFNNCLSWSATGANQTFTVPKGVTSLQANITGAGGGASTYDGANGGRGGYAQGAFSVTPGQVLNLTLGQSTAGSYGGGGLPGTGGTRGTGGRGGGLTAIWTGTPFTGTPLLLAGGGGGASGAGGPNPAGGAGGGATGGGGRSTHSVAEGGAGGTQSAGGAGAAPFTTGGPDGGTNGTQFQGGNGGVGQDSGGGGGGGWYGGGGGHGQTTTGDQFNSDGGGGGGSGYVDTTRVTGGTTSAGGGPAPGIGGAASLQWTAPAPTITAPASESTVVDLTPTVTGTGVPGTNLSLKFNGTTVICAEGAPVVVAAGGGWTCTPTQDQPVGTTTVIATQSDPASPLATYPASTADIFTIAAPPPPAPVITGPTEGAYLNNNRPTLSGTGKAGATVTVKDANGNSLCSTPPVVTGGGTWSCTVGTAIPDGPVSFIPTQADSGGTSPAGTTVHAIIDTAAPSAPTITALPSVTNDNTPTLTGTGEPNATVTVRDGNGVSVCVPAPVVGSDGKWTCTVTTALPDGAVTFTPRQTDRAGNASVAGVPTGTVIDTAAPAVPVITAPTQGAHLADNTPTLTGTGEVGATVTVRDGNGVSVCSPLPVVQEDGTWTCTVATALPDGPVSFTPRQTDPAGNVSAAGTTVNVIIDTVAAAPVITSPTEGAYLSDNTPDLSGTGEVGATVTVLDKDGNIVCSPLPVVGSNGKWTCTVVTALDDGPNSFTPTQTDLAGNVSAAGTTVNVIIDTVAPVAPVITAPTDGSYLTDSTPDLSGTGEVGAKVTVLDKDGNVVCSPLPVVQDDGTWTCTVKTALPEGPNSFTPTQTDQAGNESVTGDTVNVIVDTVADAPVITAPTDGAYLKDNTPDLTGTGEVGATVTVVDKDGNSVCSPLPVVQEDGTWSCTVATALADGPNSFTPTQTDVAGNVSVAGTTVDVTIDTVVEAPVITAPTEGAYLKDNTPDLTGTGEVGATVTVVDIDGNSVCTPLPVVQEDGTWSCTVATALPEGANSFTPTQTDLAGNVSVAGTTVNVIIDTLAPGAPEITAPTDGAYLKVNTPDLTGTGEIGSTVTIVDKDGNSVCSPLPVVQEDGTWSCTVATALADGPNSFTPTQTDLAGNVSAAGTTVNVTIDTVVEAPVITGPTDGAYLKDNTPDLTGTGEVGATVTILDSDGNSVCSPLPVVQEDGTWSCTVATALADGANSFTPTQTDLAGNVSVAGTTVHVTIDTVVDAPVITAPTEGAYLKDNTPDLTGTGEVGATVTVVDKDGNSVCSPLPVVQGDGTWSCTVATALAEGANSFTPTQTDLAGNVSVAGTTVNVTIDTVIDAPVITAPTDGAYLKDNTPDLTGTGEIGATVTIVDKDGNSVCSPLPVVQEDGTWSCTVATALADGPNSFTPTQTDLAGNVSAAGTTVNVTIDTVVEAPVITAPTDGAYLKDNTPDLTGTGEAGATVTVVDINGNSVCSPLPVVQEDGTWSCTVATALADGANSFTPTQTDLAGNVSVAGPTVHVVVDTITPGAPVITAPTEGAYLKDNTPDLTGTGEVGATVTVIDINGNSVCSPLPVVGLDGKWSCTVATALADGANSFTPTQTDLAGNVSAAGTTVDVTIDTVVEAPVITAPTDGAYLNDNTPDLTGTGEVGATVTVTDINGNSVCTPLPVVQGDGTWSCTVATALPDGANSFTPTQTDLAGNVSAAGTTVHVTIDTVVDAPVITAPTEGAYLKDNTPDLTGTGEVGATVTVTDINGNSVCTPLPIVQGDGTWSCTVATALADGANSFTPTQTDLAGNVSVAGTTVNVTIDTLVEAPVITAPTEGEYLKDNTPDLTGTGEVGATVTVVDKDGNSVCSPLPVVGLDGTWKCTVATALADGANSFTPTQTDLAGNVSVAGTTVNVTIDTVVEAPVITAPTEGEYLKDNTPDLTGTGEVGATVTVTDKDGNSVCSPLPVVQGDGTWSCTVATALADGPNSFTPTQTDLAGNVSVAGTTVNVTIDTVVEAPVITAPTEGEYLKDNNPDLTGTGEVGAMVTVVDKDGNSVCSPLPVVGLDGTWKCTVVTALADGANSFTPTQTDLAGNVSAAGTTVNVIVDTVVEAPVITAPTEGAYLKDNTPDLTGTGEVGATVTVVDKDGNSVCSPLPVVGLDGTWKCTVATALPDGANSFTPTQTDLAGNVSVAGTTVNVIVDTVVEAPVITAPIEGAYLKDNTPDLTGTGEVGATVTVVDKDGNSVCSPLPVVGLDGTWSCTVATALADGANSFTPTQTDLAGNVSAAGTTVNVTIDTVVEAPVITAPIEGAYLKDSTPDLTGTGEVGATVTIVDKDGNSVCSPLPVVGLDGTWKCTVATALPDGANSFTPTQTDLAGNVSVAGTTVNVIVDTVVEAPVITAPIEGAYLSDSTPDLTGTGEVGATVTVVDKDGNSVCSPLPVVQKDGTWSCTVATALPDGPNSFTPTQTDLAGNVSVAGTTVNVTIDTGVAPPVITSPTEGAYLKDNTPDLTGTGEVGATVTVVDKDGNSVCSPLPVVGLDGTWKCTVVTALADGANSFTPTQTDLAGNVSAAGTTVNVTIDTVVEAPVITAPTEGAYLKDNTPDLTGTGEVGATVTVTDINGNSVCTPLPVVQEDGTWSCTVATALPEGANSFTPTQTDLAGNVSVAGTTVHVTIDTVVDAPVITAPTEGAYLKDNTPDLTGTGEVGATVTVTDINGNSVCSPLPVVQGDGTWSCTVATALPDGANSFTPTQTDLAGNVSAAGTTVNVTIDTVVAAPVITAPTEGAYLKDSTPDLTGTGEVGATVTIVDKDGNSVCSPLPVVGLDGTWKCTVATALADGPNSFTPTQTDLAGNVSAAGTTVNVTIDTIVPAAPVITGPTEGAYLSDSTPDLTGTGEVGATVTIVDKDGNSVCSPRPVVGLDGTWSCTVATALPDGANSFTPTQTDLAGNVSAAGTTVHVTIDTVVAAPVITGPTDGAYLKDNTPDLTGTGEVGATVTVVDKDGNSVCSPLPVVGLDGKWSCTVVTALADGANSFTPTQTDLAGNVSAAGTTVHVTIDTVVAAPAITVPQQYSYLNDNTPDLTGTGEVGATVTVVDKDGNSVCSPLPVVGLDGKWSCTVATALADGANSFTPTQTDRAGNVSAAGPTVNVIIDTVVGAPVITAPTDGAYLKDNTPDLTGTGEVGATVTVKDVNGNVVCLPRPVVGLDGTWSCTVATALPDGANSFTPTQTDLAGNVSAAGTTVHVTIDTVVAAPVITGPTDGAYLKDNTPDLTGTGEVGATVTVVDKDGNSVCSPLPVVGLDGKWSCTVATALADGANSFTPTQTDLAGNVSAAGATVHVTIDTVVGAPAINGPVDGALLRDNTPTLTGVGEVGAAVTVKDTDGHVVCTPLPVVQQDGTWSCTPTTALAEGAHSFTPTQTDLAGNVSAAGPTVHVLIDTKAAPPVITAPANGAHLKDNTPTLTGTGEVGATVTIKDKNGKVVCTPLPVVGSNGTWTCTPADALADGPSSFTPTQTDPAGNTSPAGTTITVVIDTSPPAAPTINPLPTTTDHHLLLSGTGEPGATIVIVDEAGRLVCTQPALVAADGTWTCTPKGALPDGAYKFTAIQTDAAGNISSVSPSVTTVIDTVAPPAPVVTAPKNNTVFNDGTPNPAITGIRGTAGDTITVTEAGKAICSTKVKADGTWTCRPATPLALGTHRLSITETDPLGNVSAPTALALVKRPVTDLQVTSTTSRGDITVGQNTTIIVTVSNIGLDEETMAKVADPIAGAIRFVSSTATAGTYNPGTGLWTVGRLAAGARQTLTLTIAGATVGSAAVPFTVSGDITDVSGSNNSSTVTINVAAAPATSGVSVVTTVTEQVVVTPVVDAGPGPGGLAYTGYNVAAWTGLAGLLLLGGMLILRASRRRHGATGAHLE